MRLLIAAALPLLVSAAVTGDRPNVLKERQLDSLLGLLSSVLSGPKQPVSVQKLAPEYNPGAIREIVTWGPFKLNPSNGTRQDGPIKFDPNSDVLVSTLTGMCNDCTVLTAIPEMALQDGTQADLRYGLYNHHLVTADVGRMPIMLPAMPTGGCNVSAILSKLGNSLPGIGGIPAIGTVNPQASSRKRQSPGMGFSMFAGSGDEFNRIMFSVPNSTVKSGFYIQKQDYLFFTTEQVNYDPVPKEVYFRLDYEYVPGHPAGYLDVGNGGILMDSCSGLDLGRPPTDKPITYKSSAWRVIANGYLIDVNPHLHDGAVDLKLFLNDKLVCDLEPVYGPSGDGWESIKSYNKCLGPVQIKVGDNITMTSNYDLTQHKQRPSNAMAHGNGGMESMEEGVMAIASYMFAQQK